MNQNLIIGVDLDNTTVEFQPYWMGVYEEWFDRQIPNVHTNEWGAVVDATHFNYSSEFFEWFGVAGGWSELPWIPGAPGALYKLAKNNQIRFLTSRYGEDAEEATRDWFFANQRVWPKAELHVDVQRKSSIPCSVYVEDAPHHIEELSDAGKTVIIFDHPWNQPDKINLNPDAPTFRAYDWHEVLNILEVL